MMREKWKKYVEKFKSLGDKVSGVKGITAVIPAVCSSFRWWRKKNRISAQKR